MKNKELQKILLTMDENAEILFYGYQTYEPGHGGRCYGLREPRIKCIKEGTFENGLVSDEDSVNVNAHRAIVRVFCDKNNYDNPFVDCEVPSVEFTLEKIEKINHRIDAVKKNDNLSEIGKENQLMQLRQKLKILSLIISLLETPNIVSDWIKQNEKIKQLVVIRI